MEEQSLQEQARKDFFWLHQHPELSNQEYETTEYIRKELKKEKIEILDLPLETGLVAQIKGAYDGVVIVLRCDIDALPLQEKSGVSYESKTPGRMHACGHDFHTAVMLNAARQLEKKKEQLHGTIKIIFQPAEEAAAGAKKIIETKALEEAAVIWGIHTAPGIAAGTLAVSEGAVMAAVDRFQVQVYGKGTHAAQPQEGTDPAVILAAMIQGIQTIISRNTNPFHAALISVTHVESGNTWNVIPESGWMEGTVRTLQPKDREQIKKRFVELVNGTAAAYGAKAEITWGNGHPAVLNPESLCIFARKVAQKKNMPVVEVEKTLGGEDFSLYQERIKGAYLKFGTGGTHPIHDPAFKVDPDALIPAIEYIVELAAESLQENLLLRNKKPEEDKSEK